MIIWEYGGYMMKYVEIELLQQIGKQLSGIQESKLY